MAQEPTFKVLDPMFLEVSITQLCLPNTSSQNQPPLSNITSQSTTTVKPKNSKSKKPTKEADHKDPHLWTREQKTKLLELIID